MGDLAVLETVLGMTLNCLVYSWGVKPVALRGAQVRDLVVLVKLGVSP